VQVDQTGIVRTLSASTHAVPLQDLRPTLDAAAALAAAVRLAPFAGETADSRRARLGFFAGPGGTLLAYRVDLPVALAFLEAPTLYVDAHDGRLLQRLNRIWFAKRAKVFLPNPVVTPTAQEVTLSWLPNEATVTESAHVKAINCLDNHHTTRVTASGFTLDIHTCDEIHKARADANFDFLLDPDDTSAARTEDAFAEVQMFYHVNKIYDFFRSLGFDTLIPSVAGRPAQLQATVNFRLPIDIMNPPQNLLQAIMQAQDPNGPLYPFDNAFFIDAASASEFLERERDSMVFGQGTAADFAYDGDVIYHEFGHAVVASTSKLNAVLGDEYGLDSSPMAMNEGYADYFSAALAGDPKMGEYAASSLPEFAAIGAIRDLTANQVCPSHLWGESHQDSRAFSGGLWQGRVAVPAQNRATYDAAVYAAMASLAQDATFEAAATATVSQVRTRLGDDVANGLQSTLQGRGLFGCSHRIVEYTAPRPAAFVEGTGSVALQPWVPGYTQIRFQVPADKNQIVVTYVLGQGIPDISGGLSTLTGQPDLRIIYSREQPIEIQYSQDSITNAGAYPEVTPRDTGRTTPQGRKIFEARLSQSVTPGAYHLMIVNRGSAQGVALNVTVEAASVTTDGGIPTGDGGTPPRDGGADGGTPSLADGGSKPPGGTGGGCSAAGWGAPTLLGLFALFFAAILRSRRREQRG
jgi:uncharacterized protein (TIGR03382 family)